MRKLRDGAGRRRTGVGLIASALAIAAMIAVFATGSSAQNNRWNGPQPDNQGRFVPDLVQILPGQVHIAHRWDRWHRRHTLLTFAAAAENHGTGPLIIKASRPNRHHRTMVARQIVRRSDGSYEVIPNVGRLRYVRSRDHSHWHFLDFMSYRLLTRDGWPVGRDHKTGFCIGDRYRVTDHSFPGTPGWPVFKFQCGRSQPRRLSVQEGLSIGWGDDYPPFLEGQFIDISGIRAGNYLLVQRVNPNHRLLDQHADNDVSTAVVHIWYGRGRTHARIIKWCTSTDRCKRMLG